MPPAHLDGGPGRPRRGSREGSPGPPVAPVRAPSHDEAPGLCPLLTADPVGGVSTWLSCPVPTTPSRHLGHQATPGSGLAAPASSPAPSPPSSPQGTCTFCPAQHSWWGPGLGPTLRPTSCSSKNPRRHTCTRVYSAPHVHARCSGSPPISPQGALGPQLPPPAPTCPRRARAIGAGRGGTRQDRCGRATRRRHGRRGPPTARL